MISIHVRKAREADVPAIRDLFARCYGPHYRYREFYDDHWLRKTVYSDNYLFLVAADDDKVLGTASVYFDTGNYTDLLGEFGRLVVDSEQRGRGIGSMLMKERIRFATQRLHFGLANTRTPHSFAQRISIKHGFQPVGFLPMASLFEERESTAVMGQLFAQARELRRNHPRIIPEAFPLAAKVLGNLGLPNDLLVIEDADSYPMHDDFQVEELAESGLPYLLRIERGRLKRRQVFGNLMLSYGYFALQASEAQYLVAKQGEIIVGAIGYVYDKVGKSIKVVELIDLDDSVGGFLLRELDRRAREELDVAYAEVAVSAYWPRIQRTLDQLGFSPAAYCPSYVFHGMERLDVLRMVKLYIPFEIGKVDLIPAVQEIFDAVAPGFLAKRIGIQVDDFTRSVSIFKGLIDAQLRSISGICRVENFRAGEVIFEEGSVKPNLYMLLKGEVEVMMGPERFVVGRILAGDVLGEISLVEDTPHSATARACRESQFIVLTHDDFRELTSRYPRIGMTVMQNIARSLGDKLRSLDITVSQLYIPYGQEESRRLMASSEDAIN
jgi:CRP-like cAMP-binding protein/GNAT superfamily N-acetyltransferase